MAYRFSDISQGDKPKILPQNGESKRHSCDCHTAWPRAGVENGVWWCRQLWLFEIGLLSVIFVKLKDLTKAEVESNFATILIEIAHMLQLRMSAHMHQPFALGGLFTNSNMAYTIFSDVTFVSSTGSNLALAAEINTVTLFANGRIWCKKSRCAANDGNIIFPTEADCSSDANQIWDFHTREEWWYGSYFTRCL